MTIRRLTGIVVGLVALSLFAIGSDTPVWPTIDLGWLGAIEHGNDWVVTYSRQLPRNGASFQEGDVIVQIDGNRLSELNPLSVALLLQTASIDAQTAVVERQEERLRLDFTPPWRVLKGFSRLHSPVVKLYHRDEPLPKIALPGLDGNKRQVTFNGHWTLLRVASLTSCGAVDLDAFNEAAKTSSPSARVLAIAPSANLQSARNVMSENGYDFPVLVAAYDFPINVLPEAGVPTYVLVSPSGQITFVAGGPYALKAIWSYYKVLAMNP